MTWPLCAPRFHSYYTYLPALTIFPRDPALSIAAIVNSISTGKFLACGAGMPSLSPNQGDEKELVQVNLKELYIFWLQQASWAPGSIPLFPLQPEGKATHIKKNATCKDPALPSNWGNTLKLWELAERNQISKWDLTAGYQILLPSGVMVNWDLDSCSQFHPVQNNSLSFRYLSLTVRSNFFPRQRLSCWLEMTMLLGCIAHCMLVSTLLVKHILTSSKPHTVKPDHLLQL